MIEAVVTIIKISLAIIVLIIIGVGIYIFYEQFLYCLSDSFALKTIYFSEPEGGSTQTGNVSNSNNPDEGDPGYESGEQSEQDHNDRDDSSTKKCTHPIEEHIYHKYIQEGKCDVCGDEDDGIRVECSTCHVKYNSHCSPYNFIDMPDFHKGLEK